MVDGTVAHASQEPSQNLRRFGSGAYSQPTHARAVLLRRRTDARMLRVGCQKAPDANAQSGKLDSQGTTP